MSAFIRELFNSTFKTNPSLERAVMTGITRVSRESIFSDLNNLNVVTTTGRQYETSFGFTQKEVSDALCEFGCQEDEESVKQWYDGFTFGETKDIYNLWSIINYLKKREFHPYWANTSSNGLIGYELRASDSSIKQQMEDLMNGGTIHTVLNEEIIFDQLDENPEAIWSLFLAGGYLKVVSRTFDGRRYRYSLTLTNLEVQIMFEDLIAGWFQAAGRINDAFMKGMIAGDTDQMNICMNKITQVTFSSFDVGSRPSVSSPRRNFIMDLC